MSRSLNLFIVRDDGAVTMGKFFSRYGRYLLGLLGALAIGFLVMKVGPAAVFRTLVSAGAWLPLIFALDLAWSAVESGAVLILYGRAARQVHLRDWVRALFVHFATFIVVPVGRASAEVARAGVLSPRVGKTRAGAAAAVMQSLTLSTNAILSAMALFALTLTTRHHAASALMSVNLLVTGTLGAVMYLVLRHVKLGGFLGRKFQKLAEMGPEMDEHVREGRSRHGLALVVCVLARSVQALQYGVILFAVSGDFSLLSAFVAEGIQLAARSMGDAIPNQVGVTESAFALCAGGIGLEGLTEKAVSIALLGRLSNLTMAGLCALGLQILPREPEDFAPTLAEKA